MFHSLWAVLLSIRVRTVEQIACPWPHLPKWLFPSDLVPQFYMDTIGLDQSTGLIFAVTNDKDEYALSAILVRRTDYLIDGESPHLLGSCKFLK